MKSRKVTNLNSNGVFARFNQMIIFFAKNIMPSHFWWWIDALEPMNVFESSSITQWSSRVYLVMKSLEQQQQNQTTTKFPEHYNSYFPWSDIGKLKPLLSFNVNLLVSHSTSLFSFFPYFSHYTHITVSIKSTSKKRRTFTSKNTVRKLICQSITTPTRW